MAIPQIGIRGWRGARILGTVLFVLMGAPRCGFTVPQPIATDASGTTRTDGVLRLARGGPGTWGVVWTTIAQVGSDGVRFCRTTNDGTVWSAPVDLSQDIPGSLDFADQPALAADGANTWVAAWDADSAAGDLLNIYRNIRFARSTDGGLNWSVPNTLNSDSATTGRVYTAPSLATDGAGNWMAVWQVQPVPTGSGSVDSDILFATSTDNGLNWSPPAPVNTNAATDDEVSDMSPRVATDGSGRWLVVWETYPTTTTLVTDVFVARSTNLGASWSAPAPLSRQGAPDPGFDTQPAVAFGNGRWVAAWASNVPLETPQALATTSSSRFPPMAARRSPPPFS